ncbi:MAG: hypothetical protein ABI822_22445 [Bryobacteraceae bacterium]
MANAATYDDVNLILRLYEMRREEKLRQARDWFSKNFKVKSLEEFNKLCPPGSDTNAYYRMVTTYWEMVASFITGGVLSEELFFQSGMELLFCWERVRDVLPEARVAFQNGGLLRNLETVATRFIQYLEKNNPGAYAAFSARVRG